MITKIQKWGTSLAVRIPKALAEDVPVQVGSRVDLTVKNGCLMLAPAKALDYDLESLLDQVAPNNLHGEVDFGQRIGKEAW